MWQNAYDAYLESKVFSAGPVELVCLLYQTATGAVKDARRHLAAGDIAARARSITKACEVVMELAVSLDHHRGGEISARLAALYDYMMRKLVQANFQQSDAPLAEVLGLLLTLSEAWEGVKVQESVMVPVPAMAGPWAQPAAQEYAGASQAWNF